MIQYLDADNSNTFTWKEIEQFILKMQQQTGQKFKKEDWEKFNRMFQKSDTDHSGSVTKEEWEAYLVAGNGMAQMAKLMQLASSKF